MTNKRYITYILIVLSYLISSDGFNHILMPNKKNTALKSHCNERKIYGSYLIGLRKTRRLLSSNNITKINELSSILNFTNQFISNYTIINNTETVVEKIIIKNVVLDVSNVKYIEIKTKNDKLTIELDKYKGSDKSNPINNLVTNVNTVEVIVSAITLLGKMTNLT